MNRRFKELLHEYKVEAFKIAHNRESCAEATEQILSFTEESLNNAYHYHFRNKNPSPERLETFTMIKNYTVEALMPPVIDKVMRRVIVLERQHDAMVQLVDRLLESLSEDEAATHDASVG